MSAKRTSLSKGSKQQTEEYRFSSSNPFDSDAYLDDKPRSTSAPRTRKGNLETYQFDKYQDEGSVTPFYSGFSAAKNRYKNDFRDSGGIENQSTQELENYSMYKSEDTTHTLNNMVRIAEDMREGASKTLVTLHHQGQQINRTHQTAADIDIDLSRGEKLLGSLGGIFSKKWKPRKAPHIKGPALTKDDSFIRRGSHMEQRQKLGLSAPLPRTEPRRFNSEPTTALQKVEMEKAKQDDALDDLSNILGELKSMARDMGSEIDRQNLALGGLQDDVDTINIRVQDANRQGRKLLGK